MKTVNTHEAKTHLSRSREEVEHGETYIINRNGKPVAELRKYEPPGRSQTDTVLSKLEINYEPTEDLSPDKWGERE